MAYLQVARLRGSVGYVLLGTQSHNVQHADMNADEEAGHEKV